MLNLQLCLPLAGLKPRQVEWLLSALMIAGAPQDTLTKYFCNFYASFSCYLELM